jgi:hypothetical protein
MKMPVRRQVKVVLAALFCAAFFLAGTEPSFTQTAGCAQTLSVGANVASALSSAAPGSTVCLNSGSYGTVSLSNVTKNPRVTVRSVSGQGASLRLNTTSGANGFVFDSLTITQWNLSGSTTKNITVKNIRFTGQADLSLCGVSNANILVDSSTFIDINVDTGAGDGRLQIAQPACRGSQPVGVTVTNNLFENTVSTVGESDGIQIGANGVVVGPGNVFRGIRQANFDRHIDSIQLYGSSNTVINGNYFINNTVDVGAYDGGIDEIITNNVFQNAVTSFRGHDGTVITHNTFFGSDFRIEGKDGAPSGMTIRDNLFRNHSVVGSMSCSSCTITHNQFSSGGFGTNNVIGTPTFLGGATPPTWAGFQLASNSIGKNAGTDGKDMGSNYFGQGPDTTPPAPAPPANVRVIRD